MNLKSGLRYLLNTKPSNQIGSGVDCVKINRKTYKNLFYISETKQAKQARAISYSPIRPLKKSLTTLYITKEYLNKGQ